MDKFSIEPDARTTSGNGIAVEHHKYEQPCQATELHIHSSIEVLFLVRGELEIVTRNNTFTLCEGEIALFRKYAIHGMNVISEDGCEYYVIKFHMSILNDFASAENINYYHSFFSIDAKVENLVWHRDELERSDIIPAVNEVIEMYSNEGIFAFFKLKLSVGKFILALMQDYYNRSPEYFNSLKFNDAMTRNIRKAIEFANANYKSPITAADAAKEAGLSYNYFSNCFSRVTGKTFTQYVNKVRINHAKYQLLIAEKNISAIAEYIGFENASYFAQEFKRQTGMTPTEFVKKYKKTGQLD